MKYWALLLAIIASGIFLRLWQLGVIPDGLTWDEAAIGYNGWSVWTTRRDEWLQRLPVSFKSFGDFKAPLAIYLNGPFTLLFGMHAWSIRLPFALAGSALIILWLFVLKGLRRLGVFAHDGTLLFGVAALSFSPWHLMFSRVGFESGLSLLLLVAGIFCLGLYVYKKQALWVSQCSAVLLVLSMYAYHSAKIVVPALLLVIFALWRKIFFRQSKHVLLSVGLALLLLAPMIRDTALGEGGARAQGLIPMSGVPITEQIEMYQKSIAANILPSFLLKGTGDEPRHVSGIYGPLTISTLLLSLLGLLLVLKAPRTKQNTNYRNFGILASIWIVIGFLPSFLSVEAPHANRALLALPGFLLLSCFALDYLLNLMLSNKTIAKKIALMALVFLLIGELFFTSAFLRDYFSEYSARATDSFQTGYPEAIQLAETARQELPPFGGVEQIIFSSNYGQPVVFALANVGGDAPVSPYRYHQGYLVKYLFQSPITNADLSRKNALLIWTINDEITVDPMGIITDRADQPRFYWYVTSGE